MTLLFRHRSFSAQSAKKGTSQQPNLMNRILNLTPKEAFQILFLAEFVPKGAGGLTNFHKKSIFQPYLNLILYKNALWVKLFSVVKLALNGGEGFTPNASFGRQNLPNST